MWGCFRKASIIVSGGSTGDIVRVHGRSFVMGLVGSLLILPSALHAKTDLLSPFREVEIDPASLAPGGRVFHVGDVVLTAKLRGAPTVRTSQARTVDVFGFMVTIPKGTLLTEFTNIRSPEPRMFSKRDGVGTRSQGSTFCNLERLALGPFTSGDARQSFKGIACFLDENRDGIFEQVSFIGQFSRREAGPVTVEPLQYQVIPGDYTSENRIDMVFAKFDKNAVVLKPVLHDLDGRHNAIRMYTNEHDNMVTEYSWGCLMATPSNTLAATTLLGATISISNPDEVGATFQGVIARSAKSHTLAQVSPYRLVSDWIPNLSAPCGDARGKGAGARKIYGTPE